MNALNTHKSAHGCLNTKAMSLWSGVDPWKTRINWRRVTALLDPRDAISVICEFWLRVGEYYPGTNALIHFY